MEDLASFFDIDLTKLDKDWCNQARTVYNYAVKLADARDARDRAKAAVDVADEDLDRKAAEVELQVRRYPDRFGLDKTTESTIKATVLIDEAYKAAQEAVHTARKKLNQRNHEVGLLEAALKALDHKRDGLESAVKLFGMGYFANPRGDAETHKAMNDGKIDKSLKKRSKGGG